MQKIDGKTEILGILGHPVEHSISPLLHNFALEKLGENCVYLPFDILPGAVENGLKGIRALNVRGVNVTIPHKSAVFPHLDHVQKEAQKIGAVNTIVREEGDRLAGYNTDVGGFRRMLEEDAGFNIKGKKVLLLGAGGASRAAGVALCEGQAAKIYVLNRTEETARELVRDWRQDYPEIFFEVGGLERDFYEPLLSEVDLVVDTTPVGMEPNVNEEPVIATDGFHSGLLVVDLVYNPPETTILTAAKEEGAEILNGLPMLLYQAAESLQLWTGEDFPVSSWYDFLQKEPGFKV